MATLLPVSEHMHERMEPELGGRQDSLQEGPATPQLLPASSVYPNVRTLTPESDQVLSIYSKVRKLSLDLSREASLYSNLRTLTPESLLPSSVYSNVKMLTPESSCIQRCEYSHPCLKGRRQERG